MDIADPIYPDIVYRFNFVQRVWSAVWCGIVEVARVQQDASATATLVTLTHLWMRNHWHLAERCDDE